MSEKPDDKRQGGDDDLDEFDTEDYEEMELLERLESLREDMEELQVLTLDEVITRIEELHHKMDTK